MNVKRNQNTAELVGLSFGDGSLIQRKNSNCLRFQLRGNVSEDKDHYDSYVIPLFNNEIMFPLFKRPVSIAKQYNFYGISLESSNIKEEFEYLGIPTGVKEELTIPRWIKINKNYLIGFLRGFLDTDGCVYCQKNYSLSNSKYHSQIRISLVSTSKNLMQQIFNILNKLDFKPLLENKMAKNSKDNFERQDYYKIVLSGGIQINRWFELIGSKNQKHYTKYLLWKKFGFCPPRTTLKERKQILKNNTFPYQYYAGVPERSNGRR